jgi:nucleoside-specific outer membrane channel protein Tsx
MRRLALGIAFALVLGAGSASADQYIPINVDSKTATFLDLSTIKEVRSHKQAWLVSVNKNTQLEHGHTVDYKLVLEDYDCEADEFSISSYLDYLINSKLSYSNEGDLISYHIPPNTIASTIEDAICQTKYDKSNILYYVDTLELVTDARKLLKTHSN